MSFEWTALGDSYASGVGAGGYLSPYEHVFNNVVCSGSSTEDVEAYQFYDKPTWGGIQYGWRPPFGVPNMATLSVGGNNIDFRGILFNCILETSLFGGEPTKPCDQQRSDTWNLLNSPDLVNDIDNLIKKIVTKATAGPIGADFKLYVTGFPEFFNAVDTGCDTVTFARTANPKPDGKEHIMMTTTLRTKYNQMSDALNAAIVDAVNRNTASGVAFININDGLLDGHRFCEAGIVEPDQDNPNLWLFHYPYNQPDPPTANAQGNEQILINATNQITQGLSAAALATTFPTISAFDDALFNAIDWVQVNETNGGNTSTFDNSIGWRAKLFHPQPVYHTTIKDLVRDRYLLDTQATNTTSSSGKQIAMASYIDPLGDPASWTRLIGYPENKLSLLVANVVNGPDTTVNTNWASVIKRASAAGKTVLGYVRTGYLGVSKQQFTTRLGSTNLADWVAQIEEDVDMWYTLYGPAANQDPAGGTQIGIGGIFFDEGWNSCGPDNMYSNLYQAITQRTKDKYPGAFTVLNPGSTMDYCFEESADVLLTFEGSYDTYTTAYVANTWTPTDPRKLWHIIYSVPDGQGAAVAAMAKSRGAGLVEITDGVPNNPYNTLPSDAFMQQVLGAVAGGTLLNEGYLPLPGEEGGGPAATPSDLTVVSFEYTSVTLSWSPSTNAVYYHVYVNSAQSLTLQATVTKVTVGGLNPGTSGFTFTVTAVGGDGTESSMSNSVSSSTKALPIKGETVLNATALISATSTTYQADVLVPYAYNRVYIWKGDTECSNSGWPINYNYYGFVCTFYMVESTTLYQYSGTSSGTWTWTSIGSVPVEQNGYTYTWTVPIGTSTIDTSQFVIQTQGYGPSVNVFHPCPTYEGSPDGSNYCA